MSKKQSTPAKTAKPAPAAKPVKTAGTAETFAVSEALQAARRNPAATAQAGLINGEGRAAHDRKLLAWIAKQA